MGCTCTTGRKREHLRDAGRIAAIALLLMTGCAHQSDKPVAVPGQSERQTPVTPRSGSRMGIADVRTITAYHNKVRADAGVGPLKWSAALAAYAQKWADHLAGTTCKVAHNTEHLYGENLFQTTAEFFTAADAARAWEAEKIDYSGGILTTSNWHAAGHYTQMVWRDTITLGCGEAACDKTLIVACNYDPPGNYIGHRPY
jgi:pathogenesis-related protein 1